MTANAVDVVDTSSLAGREIVWTNSRGSRVLHRFGATSVEWSYQHADGDPHPVVSGRDEYEAFAVAEGLVYAQFHHRTDVPNTAVSLVLDLENGRSLAIVSSIESPTEGRTRVQHTFLPGVIEERRWKSGDHSDIFARVRFHPCRCVKRRLSSARCLYVYSREGHAAASPRALSKCTNDQLGNHS